MEHGSLADNLSSNTLNWQNRLAIALGTAKGLSYLHEECLEWILHCDIKPQNILLDADYEPKVADFGLSKLFNRGGLNNSSFSRIRGTRGYMAPEWVYNLPITSKVDIYSYGIVVLEMVTGKSPTSIQIHNSEGLAEHGSRLVTWVREKMDGDASRDSWLGKILDPMMGTDYDKDKMELLVKVALQWLAVFKPGLAVEVPKDEKYKVGFTDFVHAIMSVMVFVAIAFSDHRVTDCLFPGHVKEMDQVMESFPLMVGIVCSGLFLLFPNTRYG
ncbi:hypothetical protein GH714_031115 [Hevea brasiliensis]|uniref:Protein kinase domain-containing protein n=1 Tax=Hevea brasiliensis TaxID=3981 RepID=A0A6A6LI14_HEVBR|nr:hypothetical protein GH714_031115 [Hevea brasiliensis]